MMQCDIRYTKKMTYVCKSCGTEISADQWYRKEIPECGGPSLLKQAMNLGAAVAREVTNSTDISSSEKKTRMDICSSNECGYFQQNGGDPRCGHCGCFLNLKTSWAGEECPIGKWLRVSKKQGCSTC
jgi:hypothetical protein